MGRAPGLGCPRAAGARAGPGPDTGTLMTVGRVYLDHAATSPLRPEAAEAMAPYLAGSFGNAASLHSFGREARKALEEAREEVARAVGADPGEIYFTSSGTEADNWAIKGVLFAARERRALVVSAVEHKAVLEPARWMASRGFELRILPVDRDGRVRREALERLLDPGVALVSVMLVNNEVGTVQPVREVAEAARKVGALVHTDAVQALGNLEVDLGSLGVDLASFSAHKIGGPKGVGALWVRRGVRLELLLHGGGQERGMRSGTSNVAGAVGFAAAVKAAMADFPERVSRLEALRSRLVQGVTSRLEGVRVNGDPDGHHPGILSLSVEGVDAESLLLALDARGVACSTGSACTSGAPEPSHVLQAMGLGAVARSTLRFSLGWNTTAEDVDLATQALVEAVERLRGR